MKYVLGFLFSENSFSVALIRKTKPKWQAGRLNGIGGKVEEGERYHTAMVREFKEETGVLIPEWHCFGSMKGADWIVALYTAKSDKIWETKTTTEEQVSVVDFDYPQLTYLGNAINNVPYLIQAARDFLFSTTGVKHISLSY